MATSVSAGEHIYASWGERAGKRQAGLVAAGEEVDVFPREARLTTPQIPGAPVPSGVMSFTLNSGGGQGGGARERR